MPYGRRSCELIDHGCDRWLLAKQGAHDNAEPATDMAPVCVPGRTTRDNLPPGGITVLQRWAVADSVALWVSNNRSPAADQQGQGYLGEYAGEISFRKSRP